MSQYTLYPPKSSSSGTITGVTATSPLSSTGGTTPNISITTGNLTDAGVDGIVVTGGTGAVVGSGTSLAQHVADTIHNGYLDAADWNTFNNKLDASRFNDITGGNNGTFEVDTIGWNLYNDSGRTNPATLSDQDLTYTSALSASGGNGVEIEYIYNASFTASAPNINVISSSHVQVRWNNGPTIANNPTATQLKAAWDAVPAALAIATIAITGTASKLQYINGGLFLTGGGDASPVDGTGGSVAGVTFTRNTTTPLEGVASGDLGKDAANRQGQGVSTDFIIPALDKGQELQIDFSYEGSAAMTLGSNSDVQIFIYDITNAALIPVTPVQTISGPVNTIKTFTGIFVASNTSVNYRLILHVATTNASAWDFLIDEVVVDDIISPVTATQVPSLVLLNQPISGAVTDHICVMWTDGASAWVPATIAGAALPVFGTDRTQLGFATNIVGSTASIFIRGFMDGFSIGPFVGFEQYIDNVAGGISPLPSPFTDLYVMVGMGISPTAINIQFDSHVDLISNGSGVPIKGGLLTSSAVNDGTGDVVLSPGANNSVLVANSAAAKGLNYVTTLTGINTTGSAATLTTARTIAGTNFNGSANIALANKFIVQGTADAGLSGPQFLGALATGLVKNTTTTGVLSIAAASDVNGALLTGYVSGAGTVAATDSILQGIQKLNGNDGLKANLASPTFTGTVNLPAINLINGATNGTNTVLVFKNGHIKSTQTTAPTTTINANAGTGASSSVANATDTAGVITLTLGSIGTLASGVQTTINFNTAYGVAPIVILTANNAVAASNVAVFGVFVTSTTTGFSINFATAGVATDVLKWNYMIMETQ